MRQKQFALFIIFLAFLTINFSFAADQYTLAQLNALKAQANNNDISAIHKLNYYYFNRKDFQRALYFIKKGMKLDDLNSKIDYGYFLLHGIGGVSKNYIEAKQYLKLGIQINDASALNSIGLIYDQGLGVKPNKKLAIKYYERAIRFGSEDAEYNLAMLIMPENPKLSFALFSKLVKNKNNLKSMFTFAAMFEFGAGTQHDFIKAYKWFMISKNLGYKPSIGALNNLIKKMTPEQIAEGKKLVADYNQQHDNQ